MKIDRSRLKKGTSDVPLECQLLIDKLKKCNRTELTKELVDIEAWTFGKCELYHWIDILDIFDGILEEATELEKDSEWILAIDSHMSFEDINLVLSILHFTTLLIEHSFSRHLYNSVDHLIKLLQSNDLDVVLAVLELLYMFSKRSNFIARIPALKKISLISRVSFLAETWGGKEQGFSLAECCKDKLFLYSPYHTQYFEILNDKKQLERVQLSDLSLSIKDPRKIAEYICSRLDSSIEPDQKIHVFTRVRASIYFCNYSMRLKFVIARLQALSVLALSVDINISQFIYPGFLEELVELLQIENPEIVEIQAFALRTLTSITHLERTHYPKKTGSRLYTIIEVTGASFYHGFLPGLVRSCISNLMNPKPSRTFTMSLATSLFSFLYHLASYEPGGEALVSSGMMDCLLKVINWQGTESDHITFVTRAVRVIDLITNIDMQSFKNYGGLQSFIDRLAFEINFCRGEQPNEIQINQEIEETTLGSRENTDIQHSNTGCTSSSSSSSTSVVTSKTCFPQRVALLKSMLNFLKKAIQDSTFSENIRHIMEGNLPSCLRHIISNAEYYGSSLFLLAIDVITVYVFQEPTLLPHLQDIGLTDVVLHALLNKEVPATREVLGSLPSVFNALCLNSRGLAGFLRYENPFDKFFRVFLSPAYLPAMRRRRNSDSLDTATILGTAMDELIRHQPNLRQKAIMSVIKLLEELVFLGTDHSFVCWNPQNKIDASFLQGFAKIPPNSSNIHNARNSNNNDTGTGSSDEEDDIDDEEEEEETSNSSTQQNTTQSARSNIYHSTSGISSGCRVPVPLVEYITNIMKFLYTILCNNITDDHCVEFLNAGGLTPLLHILGLPNLPIHSSINTTAQSVASVCKTLLDLSRDLRVLKLALLQLNDVVNILKPLSEHLENPGGSILIRELANCPNIEGVFSSSMYTPLRHAMNAVHCYVVMLVYIHRTGHHDIRHKILQMWLLCGKPVLKQLSTLYTSLLWESTILLALSSVESNQGNSEIFNNDVNEKLVPSDFKKLSDISWDKIVLNNKRVVLVKSADASESEEISSDGKNDSISPNSAQLKYIRDMLNSTSRLGRALADLFGQLVKLCVGAPYRQRRHVIHTPAAVARDITRNISQLLVDGMSVDKLPPSPKPKLKLTFLISAMSFTSPMLFDDKNYPFHLMISMFISRGGLETFFNMFRYALTCAGKYKTINLIDKPDLIECTSEFLESWLVFLEKLSNPKTISDSPHTIAFSPHFMKHVRNDFDITSYLKNIHSLAFDSLKYLWDIRILKLYGIKITELVFTIYRHIIIGNCIFKTCDIEKKQDKMSDNVKQLMDMGFPRKSCIDALERSGGIVEQATDFLLSNSQNVDDCSVQFSTENQNTSKSYPQCSKDNVLNENSVNDQSSLPPPPQLVDEILDKFTDDALYVCLNILDEMPDTVYRVSDLLVSIMQRSGKENRKFTLDIICKQIKTVVNSILGLLKTQENFQKHINEFFMGKLTQKASISIHLYTLLFEVHCSEGLSIPCAKAIHQNDLIGDVMLLIYKTESCITYFLEDIKRKSPTITPKWMAPLFLMLDSYEKVATLTKNRKKMHEISTKTWKWYDLGYNRWNKYTCANNQIINDAYWAGKPSVRIIHGRHRYLISFSKMLQTNEETGDQRPILINLKCLELDHKSDCNEDTTITDDDSDVELLEKKTDGDKIKYNDDFDCDECFITVPSIHVYDKYDLICSCVQIMKFPTDRDTLHAIMRVCVRLTRKHNWAVKFALSGGIKLLVSFNMESAFPGYQTLAAILIRHTLEEPKVLAQAMERVITSHTLPSILAKYRDIFYFSRQISSAITRDSKIFLETAKSLLQIDTSMFQTFDSWEDRIILKTVLPAKTSYNKIVDSISENVVEDLLRSLAVNVDIRLFEERKTNKSNNVHHVPGGGETIGGASLNKNPQNLENQNSENPTIQQSQTSSSAAGSQTTNTQTPILSKVLVMKILAAAISSFPSVASAVVEFHYTRFDCHLLNESVSALTFILDYLLPTSYNIQYLIVDKSIRECLMGAKLLIAALSASTDYRILNIVTSEVKSALNRALQMPESRIKHVRIQILCEVIETMIESSPDGPKSLRSNICYIMQKKNLLSDLARASQSIDLNLATYSALKTVTSILEPLEILMRISNHPSSLSNLKQRKNENTNNIRNRYVPLFESTPPSRNWNRSGFGCGSGSGNAGDGGDTSHVGIGGASTSSTVTVTSTAVGSSTGNVIISDNNQEVINSESSTTNNRISDVNIDDILGDFEQSDSDNHDDNIAQQNAQTQMETSSESGDDSESNPSDNDDGEMNDDDEEDENDDEERDDEDEEERSEMNLDDETRQIMEIYDHTRQSGNNSNALNSVGNYNLIMLADASGIPSSSSTSSSQQTRAIRQFRNDGPIMRGTLLASSNPHSISQNINIEHRSTGTNREEIVVMQLTSPNQQRSSTPVVNQNRNNSNENQGFVSNPTRFLFPTIEDSNLNNNNTGIHQNIDHFHHSNLLSNPTNDINHPLLVGRSQISNSYLNYDTLNVRTSDRWERLNYQLLNFNATDSPRVIFRRLLDREFLTLRNPLNANTNDNVVNSNQQSSSMTFRGTDRSDNLNLNSGFIFRVDGNNQNNLFTSRNDEENIDIVDHAGSLFGRRYSLIETPVTLFWWSEENKILGYDMYSAVAAALVVCSKLIAHFECDNPETLTNVNYHDLLEKTNFTTSEESNIQSQMSNTTLNPEITFGNTLENTIISQNAENVNNNQESRENTEPNGQNAMSEGEQEYLNDFIDRQDDETESNDINITEETNANNDAHLISNELDTSTVHREFQRIDEASNHEEIVNNSYAATLAEGISSEENNNPRDVQSVEETESEDEEEGVSEIASDKNTSSMNTDYDLNTESINSIQNDLENEVEGIHNEENNNPRGDTVSSEETESDEEDLNGFASDKNVTIIMNTDCTESIENTLQNIGNESSIENEVIRNATNVSETVFQESSTETAMEVSSGEPQCVDETVRSILGDIEIPHGIDPSFLAALPDELRNEVLTEHNRLNRTNMRNVQQPQSPQASTSCAADNRVELNSVAEVNPEFLAALPLNIQEEVLAQQRLELQRQAAATTNPDDPVDWAAFFQNLSPTLRQAVLTDMEDSQIAVLPPQIAEEAQTLRRDWESRTRHIMQERVVNQVGTTPNFSSVNRYRRNSPTTPNVHIINNYIEIAITDVEKLPPPLLDHESIASILVLIFNKDSRVYYSSLHKIIRHLCVHLPTRSWIIRSLISILEKCNSSNSQLISNQYSYGEIYNRKDIPTPTWLGMKVDPSIAATANIFHFTDSYNPEKRVTSVDDIPIQIHPQSVAPISCEVLDHLIGIAKIYPVSFLPLKVDSDECDSSNLPKNKQKPTGSGVVPQQSSQSSLLPLPTSSASNSNNVCIGDGPNFWEIILQIDNNAYTRLQQGSNPFSPNSSIRRPKPFTGNFNCKTFSDTALGKLIPMLKICKNNHTTDKLLRLLSFISVGLDEISLDDSFSLPVSIPVSSNKLRECVIDEELMPQTTDQLRIIIDTWINGTKTSEGLEDATTLILNLSKKTKKTRTVIYDLLLENLKELSRLVKGCIVNLMQDVELLNQDGSSECVANEFKKVKLSSGDSIEKGALRDRFTSDTVVISSQVNSKRKKTSDINLKSMIPLTSKSSCQIKFLRVLKVLIQIRDENNSNINSDDSSELLPHVSSIFKADLLWTRLSQCLIQLEHTSDHHAVLVLQPAVEAFFLLHAIKQKQQQQPLPQQNQTSSCSSSSTSSTSNEVQNNSQVDQKSSTSEDDLTLLNTPQTNTDKNNSNHPNQVTDKKQRKFLQFAERHRIVLNQILRQSTIHLGDGPFACLVDHARILDFDVKRKYFKTELERLDEGVRREELAVHVRRANVFEDSFRELYRRSPEEWKNRFYIVFEDEEGQDAGGLLREWYVIISREIFNPMYALFTVSPGDRVTYMINSSSHANPNHLCYYKFVGRVIAKAIYDSKLLDCYFTRSFYKHILGIQVKYTDMESEDYEFYQGLEFLMENKVSMLGYDLTFSLEVQEFGVTTVRDLIPNGRNVHVTEENKFLYIQLVCRLKMSGSIKQQLKAFLEGFYDIIPKRLISIFNEQELELLISGLPNIDIEDLRMNTEYHKYQPNSIQIQWFWRAMRSFSQADRAKFLQFVTGTSKVPLQGFGALEGMNGTQKFQIHRDDRSTDRLPSAHTCFNQLDLPVYETYDKMKSSLLKAIHECTEGFGFA